MAQQTGAIDDDCPVCFETFASKSTQICRTACNHLFCRDCVVRTLSSEFPQDSGCCPVCRAEISLFSTRNVGTGQALKVPEIDTIFGTVYLQMGKLGIASYHFDSVDDCYICYESAPTAWKLDDGSAPPVRKPFQNVAYDIASRTFTGTVAWDDAPFNGAARWEYRMQFSENFGVISAGEMQAYGPDGSEGARRQFPNELTYWRMRPTPTTIIGQIYVQGGRPGLASYHFDSLDSAYISYESAPASWQLDDGCSPPPRKRFERPAYDAESRTFTGAITWSPSFGGDARWEYEMVFSANYSSIEAGQVRAFDAAGGARSVHRFGELLRYQIFRAEEAQMLRLLYGSATRGARGGVVVLNRALLDADDLGEVLADDDLGSYSASSVESEEA